MKKLFLILIISHNLLSSNATNYYVSNSGNNGNSGTSEGSAWQTIAKLNSEMASLQPGDKVLFRRGDVFRGTLNISASGSSSTPITFGAYGNGDIPEIRASSEITGWTNYSGNVWVANSTNTEMINNFINNGNIQPLGRYPNNEFLTYESLDESAIFDSDLGFGDGHWNDAYAVIRNTAWTYHTGHISSQSGGTISLSNTIPDHWLTNFGYFFQNHINTLDFNGEWCHDTINDVLYYYSTTDPNSQQIEISTFNNCIYLDNVDYITLENIKLVFSNTNALYVSQCSNITIQNLSIDNSGVNGMQIENSPNVLIQNNTIRNSNNTGAEFNESDDLVFTNNKVLRSGLLPGRGVSNTNNYDGLKVWELSNALIEYNWIDSVGYSGIDFFNTVNAKYNYNYISHACMSLDDGGGIYTWKNQAYNEIRGNIVGDILGAPEGTDYEYLDGHGIYIDDNSKDILIESNTVFNCNLGIFLHSAFEIIVRKNTVYNNKIDLALYLGHGAPITDCSIKGNVLVSNKWYDESLNIDQWPVRMQYVLFGLNEFDSNYYINPFHNQVVYYYTDAEQYYSTVEEWQTLDGGLNDKGSPITFEESGLTNEDDLILFRYNASKAPLNITLEDLYVDKDGDFVTGEVIIEPYSSIILLKVNIELLSIETTPAGNTDFCPTNEQMDYTTIGTPSADTYEWHLTPSIAGSIEGTGKTGTVTWNEQFYGNANVYFIAYGPNDFKAVSPKFVVEMRPLLEIDAIPDGPIILPLNSANTTYSVPEVNGAKFYNWTIIPDSAGTINEQWNAVTIDWELEFQGDVQVFVNAENDCGPGINTEPLIVNISDLDPAFGVKKAFTPNYDGINELWELPFVLDYPDAVIKIYNRSNKLVIQYTGTDPHWNGADHSGTPLPMGNYLYVIDLRNGGEPLVGYVSLIK